MKTYKIHLLRQGITQANLDGIYAGSATDLPLCDEGREQIIALMRDFEYPSASKVLISPMQSSRQTAELLYPDAEIIVIDELREIAFGEFDGKNVEELQQNPDFHTWLDPKTEFTPAGGESGKDFATRAATVIQNVCEYALKSKCENIAVITHGGLIMTALALYAMPDRPPAQWACDPACGYSVTTSAATFMRDGFVEATNIIPLGYCE